MKLQILLLYSVIAFQSWSAAYTPVYTVVNDKKQCHYKDIPGTESGPESCEYICDGPLAEVKTKLLSCSDYEHFYFQLNNKWYSTWTAMTAVGGLSGLGNKKGIVEWAFISKDTKKLDNLKGLIVRFNGVDGEGKNKNALSVFEFSKTQICWKGNFSDNKLARQSLDKAGCKEKLQPEKDSK